MQKIKKYPSIKGLLSKACFAGTGALLINFWTLILIAIYINFMLRILKPGKVKPNRGELI